MPKGRTRILPLFGRRGWILNLLEGRRRRKSSLVFSFPSSLINTVFKRLDNLYHRKFGHILFAILGKQIEIKSREMFHQFCPYHFGSTDVNLVLATCIFVTSKHVVLDHILSCLGNVPFRFQRIDPLLLLFNTHPHLLYLLSQALLMTFCAF